MEKIVISCLVIFALSGCKNIVTTSIDGLPVMGHTPLRSTAYKGSDEEYHYFLVSDNFNKGIRGGEYRIPKADALIVPGEIELGEGAKFISEVEGKEIRLLLLGASNL